MPLSSFLIVTFIAIALWQWAMLPRPRSRFYATLGILIAAALATEVYGGITNRLIINNNLAYNLFGQLEALLVLYLIGLLRPNCNWTLIAAGAFFIGAFITNVILHETIYILMLETVLLNSFVLSVLLMSALWWLAQHSAVPLQKVPEFWILLGFLVYFAGIVPTIGGYEFIFRNWNIGHKIFHIVQTLCIIRYLLTAFGCLLARKRNGWMIPTA